MVSSPGVRKRVACTEAEKGLISGRRAPDFRHSSSTVGKVAKGIGEMR